LLWQTSLCDHKPWNPLTQNIAYEVLYANDVEGVFRVTGLGAVKKAHQGLAQE
jgi:hypothetical protein